MRGPLDRLYALSGLLAAIFLAGIAAIVLLQVIFNVADWVIERIAGRPIGLLIPSYADFAGYFLAAATFFALSYALRQGAHIRVNLVLMLLPERVQRVAEALAALIALAISATLTWYLFDLLYDSWRFGDRSTGLVSVALWIPQTVTVAGSAVLAIACLDTLFEVLAGKVPGHIRAAEAHLLGEEHLLDEKGES
jgi:TRAP-type C4-dicarboxylate transport system permease small subunit